MYLHIKRLLDILLSLLALPFVLLILLAVAPIIYLTDRGPVFYNAPRVGKDGKLFTMYKLRSMKVNSPELFNKDGSIYTGKEDPRVTRIGRFLRDTSIDELPQFFNVLKGDMSIVGPRAFMRMDYQGSDALEDSRRRRLEVRPGITGYSQAYYRNSISHDQKILNDVYYVEHLSFALDVRILCKTVVAVLGRKNLYGDSELADATVVDAAEMGKEPAHE